MSEWLKKKKEKETAVEKLYLVLKECDSSIFPPWVICPRVIHQIGVGGRKHSWIRALHTPELCWSKSGYFPTEELGWALKKKPNNVCWCAAHWVRVQMYRCTSVPTLASTFSKGKRRQMKKWSKREHIRSCTEWMAHSIRSRKNISISHRRSKDKEGQLIRRRLGRSGQQPHSTGCLTSIYGICSRQF